MNFCSAGLRMDGTENAGMRFRRSQFCICVHGCHKYMKALSSPSKYYRLALCYYDRPHVHSKYFGVLCTEGTATSEMEGIYIWRKKCDCAFLVKHWEHRLFPSDIHSLYTSGLCQQFNKSSFCRSEGRAKFFMLVFDLMNSRFLSDNTHTLGRELLPA